MHRERGTVLILHEDEGTRLRLAELLAQRGLSWIRQGGSWKTLDRRGPHRVDAVLFSIPAEPCRAAVERLESAQRDYSTARIVALTPTSDVALTRSLLRAGAFDCLEESASDADIVQAVAEAARRPVTGQANDPKRPAANGDGLTSLPGHSAFLDTLAGLRSLCRRCSEPLAVMMLDLDRFSYCNEAHSPAFGDSVLRWFAEILREVCRASDIVARHQADRFIAAFPGSGADQAKKLAFRCRRRMGEVPIACGDHRPEITVSVGIADSTAGVIETEQQLIRRARMALEHAKERGRGQTITWDELVNGDLQGETLGLVPNEAVSRWVERAHQQLRYTYMESTRALVAAVEAKDPFTRAHSLTVATYAEAFGKRMGLPRRMINTIRAAAALHDVGKIGVPDAILTKPGPLTSTEFETIKQHPETALSILG
ncbi:MAG: diguanylate cyclase, partial [Planctomycetes bacterium]|nr:diguanylate cyclase [Planctomycetota bacterium]